MRILITGATGFIGRYVLANERMRKHQVLALVRTPGTLPLADHVQPLQGDLRSLEACTADIIKFDPEVCIHLAWSGIPDFSLAMSLKNLDQSTALLNMLAEKTKCRKFILSGSCFEYGIIDGACAEDRPCTINSNFSWAKHALYDFASLLCRQQDITLIWLRFFYVYGPLQRSGSLIPTVVKSLKQGQCPAINNPFNANDFIYVADVAEAVVSAVEACAPSGIYNVGSGMAHQVLDVCKAAEKAISGKDEFTRRLGGQEGKAAINFWADVRKAKQALGWQATTSLEQGIGSYMEQV